MRTIKFRGWDKWNKKMLAPLSGIIWGRALVPTDYVQGLFDGVKHENYAYCYEGEMMDVSNVELMQYTGLHDKHGKEIYEGDILGNEWGKYRLYWDSGAFIAKSEDGFCFHLIALDLTALEVIGNIYENPELLNV